MRRLRFISIALAAALLPVFPVAAQDAAHPDLARDGDQLVLNALGQRLALPMPDWLEGTSVDISALSMARETSFEATDEQANLVFYPRAESEAFWTTRIGARISTDDNPNLKAYRDVVIIGYAQLCRPELTAIFQLTPDEGETLAPLGFACGGYVDGLPGYSGKGEVMVMRFLKTEKGVGVVYQEWLGDAFDPAKPETWPVETRTVEQRASTLMSDTTLALVD